jgi:two-component system nitrate/nitrite sensor histidine kinase NarX
MALQQVLRNGFAYRPWRWLWRDAQNVDACQRLLLELPLRLLQQPGSDAPLLAVLDGLRQRLKARHAQLLLPLAGQTGWRQLATGNATGDCPAHGGTPELPPAGSLHLCAECLQAGRHRLICGVAVEDGSRAALVLEFARAPGNAARSELREAGRLLGETLRTLNEDRQQRRRELAAERGMLSRELHDSVAQQLSYMQIRVSRLHALLADPEQQAGAPAMLDDLRATLQLLHRQVRELIATARLTMDGRSLRQALEASVDEFARRSSCVFSLDNRLPAERIGPEAELQVLQIVREALANVVRHSHARQVRVALLARPGQGIEVVVEDDGVGLPQALPEDNHYGLRIMRERAAAIGAHLEISAAEPRGTRVRLSWRRG